MLYSSKDLYFIKVDNARRFGLLYAGIQKTADEPNNDKYFIAQKISDGEYKMVTLDDKIVYDDVVMDYQNVVVTTARSFIGIVTNPKKNYSLKKLIEMESDINNFRNEFKNFKVINGCDTIKAN